MKRLLLLGAAVAALLGPAPVTTALAQPIGQQWSAANTSAAAPISPVRTVAVPQHAGLLVQAYPNPSALGTDLTLSIYTSQAGAATLRLTDVLGREVSQQPASLPAGATTLPLLGASQLATGVYLLRVQQGQQHQVLKLVRQ